MSNVLDCNYKHSRNLNHKWIKWDCRETFIKEFLNKTFPQKFVIGTWEIIDSQDKISNQADIIVYDEGMPIFYYGDKSHFLSWWVLAHIEVKSKLDRQELIKSFEITKSIKNLQRDIDAIMCQGDLPKTIPSFIFAYESISPKLINKYTLDYYNTHESNIDNCIDGICILNKASFLKRDKTFWEAYNNEDSLMLFFTKLFDSMTKNRSWRPNIVKYMDNIMLMPDYIKEKKKWKPPTFEK